MATLPREARDGLMRAWLAILTEKHPQYAWIATDQMSEEVNDQFATSDTRRVRQAPTTA